MRNTAMAVVLIAFLAPAAGLAQQPTGTGGAGNGTTSAPSAAAPNDKSGVYDQLNLFGEAFERIRRDAVDPVPDKRLVRTAISGMLASLDPRSAYLSESQYKALQDRTANRTGSTGLVVTLKKSQVAVIAPRAGSPAAKADIKPGDVIFTIDKEPTFDLTLPEVEQKLSGPAGSEVTLLLRRGDSGPLTVKLTRAAGPFPTVTHRLADGDVGYIRIAGFDDATPQQLADAVNDLRQQAGNKLIGFVLDLRDNPGGSFSDAVKAADDFIDKGDVAVVKSRKDGEVKHIAAFPGDIASGQPIVALVNAGTAREAELVAGALQDSHRALLLGSKTFGDADIETVIPLADNNGAIKLTTARFLTPSGRTIENKGLEPDLDVSPLKIQKVAETDRIREADLHGALKNPDATQSPPAGPKVPAKNPIRATPPAGKHPTVATSDIGTAGDEQLSEAIDVLRGLALSGGRGVAAAR
jgi:carboxyl-terminal processing protease